MHVTSKKAPGTLGIIRECQHQARKRRRHSNSGDAGNGGKTLLQQVMPAIQEEVTMYVFPEMNLRGLVTSSYIHVSMSDLYIARIGLPIWLQQNKQTNHGNI
jgi:hypothetical protein